MCGVPLNDELCYSTADVVYRVERKRDTEDTCCTLCIQRVICLMKDFKITQERRQ
jgi:hypothetical protein